MAQASRGKVRRRAQWGGGGGPSSNSVAIGQLGLHTSDIGWVRWVNIVHETDCRQWFGVAWLSR